MDLFDLVTQKKSIFGIFVSLVVTNPCDLGSKIQSWILPKKRTLIVYCFPRKYCLVFRRFFVKKKNSDTAVGTIKLVSELTGTVSFLHNLRCLYVSFGIGAITINAVQLSPRDAVTNVSSVNEYIKNTVAEVTQHFNMKETTATNGPDGTVSRKTQVSLVLLEKGMRLLQDNVKNINEEYLGEIDLHIE